MNSKNEITDLIETYIPLEERDKIDTSEENKEIINEDYVKELKKYASIESLTTAALVAITALTTYYVFTFNPLIDNNGLLYMYSLMIAPAGFILLSLHLYAILEMYFTGQKSIPVQLDVLYFSFIIIGGVTFYILYKLYQLYNISKTPLTIGFNIAIIILFSEVALSYWLSHECTARIISKKYPNLFPLKPKTNKRKKIKTIRYTIKPRPAAFYLTKHKSDYTIWQEHPCFIKYKK
ncbi:MAG: hypothetical protein QXS02_05430 [Candidatus Thermoplasmatota archaeon]